MSDTPATATLDPGAGDTVLTAPPGSRRMRWHQTLAVVRIELVRLLRHRRALGAVALAALPVFTMAAWCFAALKVDAVGGTPISQVASMYAEIYQGFMMAMVTFFSCVVIFSNLVRRELRDRTLHYYCLSPLPRQVLLVGKYLGGVVAGWLILGSATLLSFAFAYLPYLKRDRPGFDSFFFDGPGFSHLGAYLAVTALAVVGYGAVFLFFGLVFKNPVIPALLFYAWEIGNFLLPPTLKKLSVSHYLLTLLPVPVDDGPFAILAAAPPPWLAVPGLLLLAAVLVAISAMRMRRLEVLYGED